MLSFDVILAVDSNGGIGLNNALPWSIKEDLQFFKQTTNYTQFPTHKNILIMGRKTWDSLGKKLPNRIHVIITSNVSITNTDPDIYYVTSLHNALQLCLHLKNTSNVYNIFVVGGSLLYSEALKHPLLKYVYLTLIQSTFTVDTRINLSDITSNSKLTLIESTHLGCLKDTLNNIDVNCEIHKYQNNDEGEMQYLRLLKNTFENGNQRQTRNSGTYSDFGGQIVFDLNNGFPLLTTKKVFFRGIFEEAKHLLLLGNTNTNVLSMKGVKIWEPNTSTEFLAKNNLPYEQGDIGPMYGFQLRHFNASYHGMTYNYDGKGVDQLQNCLDLLLTDKYSRRIMMTTYNPSQAKEGVLYPCHGIVIQFYVKENNKLCCHMYQRSVDLICGLPFNIASYALILHIVVCMLNNKITNPDLEFTVGTLTMSFGDIHIYTADDHISAVKEQIQRIPYVFPKLNIKKQFTTLDDLEFTDITLVDYKSHPAIKVSMVA